MKALSVHPYFAMSIAVGIKTIEVRTWKTDFRGDILICSTAQKIHGLIPSHALGVVELVNVVPFDRKKHLKAADLLPNEIDKDFKGYAWILKNPRVIKPIPIKGKLSLWEFDNEAAIEYLPKPKTKEEDKELDRIYWEPLIF